MNSYQRRQEKRRRADRDETDNPKAETIIVVREEGTQNAKMKGRRLLQWSSGVAWSILLLIAGSLLGPFAARHLPGPTVDAAVTEGQENPPNPQVNGWDAAHPCHVYDVSVSAYEPDLRKNVLDSLHARVVFPKPIKKEFSIGALPVPINAVFKGKVEQREAFPMRPLLYDSQNGCHFLGQNSVPPNISAVFDEGTDTLVIEGTNVEGGIYAELIVADGAISPALTMYNRQLVAEGRYTYTSKLFDIPVTRSLKIDVHELLEKH